MEHGDIDTVKRLAKKHVGFIAEKDSGDFKKENWRVMASGMKHGME